MKVFCSVSGLLVILLISDSFVPIYAPFEECAYKVFKAASSFMQSPAGKAAAKATGKVLVEVTKKYVSDNYVTNMGAQGDKLASDITVVKKMFGRAAQGDASQVTVKDQLTLDYGSLSDLSKKDLCREFKPFQSGDFE